MEEIKNELEKIYPDATVIDMHNMIQDLTDLCITCIKTTIQNEKKQAANDNEKIPEKSS